MDELKQLLNQQTQPQRVLSDTQKLVQKHLQDKNHIITEEELRSIRVGMVPFPGGGFEMDSASFRLRVNEYNTDPSSAG